MVRKVCTLMVMTLAVCGAFTVAGAPDADAQGVPSCVLEILADPDPPAPTPSGDSDADTVGEGGEGDTLVGSDELVVEHDCADAQAYPGPFTNIPAVPASPFIAPDLTAPSPPVVEQIEETVTTTTSTSTSTVGSSRDLAQGGTETYVLAYLGTGLLAFGAFAMGIRRGERRG